MRSALLLVPEAAPATGPDLTRYLVVCGLAIAGLIALAWVFRRFVAGHVKARAARRSLQVLDVLPLSGKQKLVVVRCYDRSFLLGLGEKEVRAIAELDGETAPAEPGSAPPAGPRVPFTLELAHELRPRPSAARSESAGARADLGGTGGVLA